MLSISSFPNPSLFSFSSPTPPPSVSGELRRPIAGIGVFASHSSSNILKSNRKSRNGRSTLLYDDFDDEYEEEEGEESEGDEESEDNSSDLEYDDRRSSQNGLIYSSIANRESGTRRKLQKGHKNRTKTMQNRKPSYGSTDVDAGTNGQLENGSFTESRFLKLIEELDFDEKWFPLINYLSTYGLKESHFTSIYERHLPSLQINLGSAKERLEYLLSIGVKHRDIKKILVRQPQILEYTVDNNMKSHVAFLHDIGIPHSRIGQIISAAPSLFSYSVEQSLKPTIRYLVEEVGIKESDIGKVVQLSPQILVQRIDNTWTSRFTFLSKELGAPRDNVVKMVTKHPQLLHYSIEDGILPRINFLRSIGMKNSEIVKVLTSLTQVLSLSLEGNLKPKYLYLVNELRNEVRSLTKYPTYLSLSLDQRIRPRHKFLVSLRKAPKGPFPLSSFVPTDESFCQQWAGTSVDKYIAFRQKLLLSDLADKYGRKG